MNVYNDVLRMSLVTLAMLGAINSATNAAAQSVTPEETVRSVRKMLERLPYYGHMSTMTTAGNISAQTQFLQVKNDAYAYRRFGRGPGRLLLCLQHLMGTLENWDPAVTDPLAAAREVILFNNAGVGRSAA